MHAHAHGTQGGHHHSHLPSLSIDEVLHRTPPIWPAARPAMPAMCCKRCLRGVIEHLWRLVRAVRHVCCMSHDDHGIDAFDITDEADRGAGCGPWPWALPQEMTTANDVATVALACRAVAHWCDDACDTVLDTGRRDEVTLAVLMHVRETEEELEELVDCLIPQFDRRGALRASDQLLERLTDLVMTRW